MAMDDINGATFNFYDDPSATADFGDVGSGFVLDLALGQRPLADLGSGLPLGPPVGEHLGHRPGVDGNLNLGANFFVGRGYWRPLRHPGWNLGLVGGIGPVFSRGDVKVEQGHRQLRRSGI